jgi:hypothetical protein
MVMRLGLRADAAARWLRRAAWWLRTPRSASGRDGLENGLEIFRKPMSSISSASSSTTISHRERTCRA